MLLLPLFIRDGFPRMTALLMSTYEAGQWVLLVGIGVAALLSIVLPVVAIYLLVTMAPFAVVAPVVGPLLDKFRNGRRYALAATLYHGICQRDWFHARARGYATTLDAALHGNDIPRSVVDNLIATTRAGAEPLRRYLGRNRPYACSNLVRGALDDSCAVG